MNERQEFPIDIKWKGIDEIKVSVRRRGKSAFFSVIGRQFGYGALTVLAFVFLTDGFTNPSSFRSASFLY